MGYVYCVYRVFGCSTRNAHRWQDFVELRHKYSESERLYRSRLRELETLLNQTTKRVKQLESEKQVCQISCRLFCCQIYANCLRLLQKLNLITDRVCTESNAIASVCPSVSTLSFKPTDLWPCSFACVWVTTLARRGLKLKVTGQGHGWTRSVWPRSSIRDSF